MSVVSSNLVIRIAAAHSAFCFVLFGNLKKCACVCVSLVVLCVCVCVCVSLVDFAGGLRILLYFLILTLQAPNKNCSRRHFNFFTFFFEENKA